MGPVCEISMPDSGNELYRSYREERYKNALLLGSVKDEIRACMVGSCKKKTLRALLCSTFSSANVSSLLQTVVPHESSKKDDKLHENQADVHAVRQ